MIQVGPDRPALCTPHPSGTLPPCWTLAAWAWLQWPPPSIYYLLWPSVHQRWASFVLRLHAQVGVPVISEVQVPSVSMAG